MSAVQKSWPYGPAHQRRRALLDPFVRAGQYRCARCHEPILPGEPWDLGHVDGDYSRYAGPEHSRCNRATAGRWLVGPEPEPDPERDGLRADDPRWAVPWLEEFREVPGNAVWPRLMTVPHPRAIGSLGAEFAAWAEAREGRPLRWWQRLVGTRLLEIDEAGELCWRAVILSMARQLGKSWLLRELMLWRMHQGDRFGEPQDMVHTGKDLQVCQEIQLPARYWAKDQPELYKVREVNGQEQIQYLPDKSRWMLRAKESAYGLSVSVAAVDEAWKVKPETLDESVVPTMVERAQPQLWLVSTAHRLATSLMLRRRRAALEQLETGEGDLIVEWSAPAEAPIVDVDAWRLASPHWTRQREQLIREQLEAAWAGEIDPDAEESDPEQSFRAQWLNQWPRRRTLPPGNVEDLLPGGLWASLAEPGLEAGKDVFAGLEDDYGRGAAVACCARLPDGRYEVDGLLFDDWDSAVIWIQRLHLFRPVRELHVGASLLDRLPRDGSVPRASPAAASQTRDGLAVFRDLAVSRLLAHDVNTAELDLAVTTAQVRETVSGLQVARGPKHLVKALVWAVAAAHRPAPVPAVY